jgi:hypothetical protein
MRGARILPFVLATLGCQAVADPGVEYVDCLSEPSGRYVETFDRPLPSSARCWRTEHLESPGYLQESDDGDLFIHPSGDAGSQWLGQEQGSLFFHEVTGDFLAVARAEAVAGLPIGDHCLNSNEAAGLAVRRREPLAWSLLLVRPDLDEDGLMDPALCGDDPATPPAAQVTKSSYGFAVDATDIISGVGSDAEADIALCRKDATLFYFVQDAATRAAAEAAGRRPNLKEGFHSIEVGYGPLDVGLTATAAAVGGTLPEGHFNWLFLQDYLAKHPESCASALENFAYPEDE